MTAQTKSASKYAFIFIVLASYIFLKSFGLNVGKINISSKTLTTTLVCRRK